MADATCAWVECSRPPRSPRALYCSPQCKDRSNHTVLCAAGCGRRAWKGGTSAASGTIRCRSCITVDRGVRPTACEYCGGEFESQPRGKGWTRTCSKSCAANLELRTGVHPFADRPRRTIEERRAAWRRKNWTKRAARKLVPSEPYTLAEIAERDAFRCGLCRRKVRMDLAGRHPRSPSIDHVVPLSLGGDDTRANVQLAHLGCNVKKGNRVLTAEQLRLVG